VSIQKTERKMKLKKDDPVIVVRGKRSDKGKTGKILRILPEKQRVVVEKVHVVKEYVRANPQKNIQGGIVDREGSIPLSSVMYYCRECEQGVRVGYTVFQAAADQDGAANTGKSSKGAKPGKQRICKKCGVVLD
jgi:large subunit ribosomal protein L24